MGKGKNNTFKMLKLLKMKDNIKTLIN